MHRRQFIQRASAAAVTLGVSPMYEQDLVETSQIPSSGERVPRVGLGTWQTFDVGSDSQARTRLRETLEEFHRAGGRVIDTSPMYGSSEQVLGDLMRETRLRNGTFVATKVWTQGQRAGIQQMERSMQQLGVDRVELMQIHNLVDWQVHLRTLREWKERGTVRYIGISHYQESSYDTVLRIVNTEPLDFVQLNLSIVEPTSATAILAACARRGVAFIANRPFGGGGAFARIRNTPLPPIAAEVRAGTWAQFMLKWLLSHEEVTCAIPGTGNARHAIENVAAARGPAVTPQQRALMRTAWERI